MTRRDRMAGVVALVFTVAAVALAVAGRGEYDPNLAILTATLIAIVWYTFFTFQAVHRAPPAWVNIDLTRKVVAEQSRVSVEVSNPTPFSFEVSATATFWCDGRKIHERSLHGGPIGEYFPLGPSEVLVLPFPWSELPYQDDGRGGFHPHYRDELIRITAEWRDRLGRKGRIGPKHWTNGGWVRVVSKAEITRLQTPIDERPVKNDT